jgi:hypothetical protein
MFRLFFSSAFFLASSFFLLASSGTAHAQSPEGLHLITSPLPINLSAEPGASVQAAIKVKNDGSREEKLKISVLKFKAYDETGKPRIMDPEMGDDFINWVSFSENPITVASGEWKTVVATWNVPKEAALSYYYAIFFSRANEEVDTADRQTAIMGGSAVMALLEAKVPGAKREVSVADFTASRTMYEFLPTAFRVRLANTGNVPVAPHGNIFITQGDKDVATLDVNPSKGNVLPGSGRIFDQAWTDGFPVYREKTENGKAVLDENGNIVFELFWDWKDASKLRFGKYTAKLVMVYDDGTRDVPLEAEVSFWVMPWRLIGASAVILFFAFIGFKNTFLGFFRKIRTFGKA